jgi:epoxyqueuosine reductase
MTEPKISFARVSRLCMSSGITAEAVIPVPAELDPTGLDRMLDDGVGDMKFMRRHRRLRLNPGELAPGSSAVLAATLAYQPELTEEKSGSETLKRARYAAGRDYHRLFRATLSRVGRQLLDRDGAPYPYRACVDSAPLLERTLAQQAGLGWLGKNSMLITPRRGSYQFLGFLFTAAPLELHAGPHGQDRCGACARCHDACPTDALSGRRVLSERCISYLTIEHAGVIPRELARNFNGWWFGCDVCQEVCPWNRFAPEAADGRLEGRDEEEELLEITAEDFDSYFAGRAVRRISYDQFRRNLLVALWSLGRRRDWQAIVEEGLPLVRRQAGELGIT